MPTKITPGLFKKTVIQREDGKDYLIRWSIFSCRWFAIKLHKILISDDDCLHDHPWAFITILLWGGYKEHHSPVYNEDGSLKYHRWSKHHAFTILYRHLHWIHRLEIDKPVTSLVITFKKHKDWGFFTPKGFINWRQYRSSGSCENH